jgi:glycosyltransferase involved in cell wall biosynthesis
MNDPMRVLHVSPYFAPAFRYGGPPRSVLGLCKGLQHAGVHVEVLTTAANGPTDLPASPPDGDEYEGIPVRYLPVAFPRRFFGARMRIPLTTALERADLCHIHGIWNVPEWSAARLARARQVPYVMSPRGMLQAGALNQGRWRKRIAYRLFEQANLAGAALLHATSDTEADTLRLLGLDVPVVVAPNGVDTAAAANAHDGFRERLEIPLNAFVVLFLGRIHPIKRLDLLAEAFDSVRRSRPTTHLVLAGPDERGYLADVLRRLTDHAGFVHVVETLSEADRWALLRASNVLVQCSDSESFGLAIVEGMAAGIPVVATRTCPWPEIEKRRCGFWVEQSAAEVAAAVEVLVADRAQAAAMGERGAVFARERYGWEVIARQVAASYAALLAERRRRQVA